MNKIYTVFILFMIVPPSFPANARSGARKIWNGCPLGLFDSIRKHNGSKPSQKPIVLQTKLEVLHIRDVPDSGGTYGLDIK